MENPTRTAEYLARKGARLQELRTTLEDVYAQAPAKRLLEVGCGHGHFLTAYAAAHPEVHCVGIDIILDRLERADRKKNRADVDNLRFVRAEAWEFLECLPKGVSFDTFFILFPDPWPKRRHHKNRILQSPFLDALAEKSSPGARLHFRTDFEPYFKEARQTVKEHAKWELFDTEPWPFEHKTVFEERADSHYSLIAIRQ